jgi:hypothetical protein
MNVIPLRKIRDTVVEILDEVREDAPEVLIAFTLKNNEHLTITSNCDNVTLLIGALERMKFYLLEGQ